MQCDTRHKAVLMRFGTAHKCLKSLFSICDNAMGPESFHKPEKNLGVFSAVLPLAKRKREKTDGSTRSVKGTDDRLPQLPCFRDILTQHVRSVSVVGPNGSGGSGQPGGKILPGRLPQEPFGLSGINIRRAPGVFRKENGRIARPAGFFKIFSAPS